MAALKDYQQVKQLVKADFPGAGTVYNDKRKGFRRLKFTWIRGTVENIAKVNEMLKAANIQACAGSATSRYAGRSTLTVKIQYQE